MASSPTITGLQADQVTFDGRSATPFAGVTIADPTPGATDTVYLSIVQPQFISPVPPSLADGAGFDGLTRAPFDPGTAHIPIQDFTLSGTAAQVTAEVDALVYSPGSSDATENDLYIGVSSSSGASDPQDASTAERNVTAADVSVSPTVAYAGDGTFTLTAVAPIGTQGVEFSAVVDGARQDLGAGTANGDGTYTVQDLVGSATQSFIEATFSDGAGDSLTATADFSLTAGLPGKPYAAEQDSYSADGSALTATSRFRPDGSRTVDVEAAGQTLQAYQFDTFLNHGQPDNTFVFDPGHGLDVVRQFRAGGADHDTLSLSGSDFASVAQVLRDTANGPGGAVITDPVTGDAVRLTGVSKAQLVANRGDLALHG